MAVKKDAAKPKVKPISRGRRPIAVRDEKFVDLIAKGEVPAKAYMKAGFKKTKNAATNAHQKLANPEIQTALDKRKAYFRSIADVEAKDIIGAQQEIAFASIEDALDSTGRLDFVKAKKNGSAKLIKKISRSQTQYGESVAVEFYSRAEALGHLADILGLKQMPKTNDADIELLRLRSLIVARATEKGISEQEETRLFINEYADKYGVKPEIREKLLTETVQ